jgi:hypothetical protein
MGSRPIGITIIAIILAVGGIFSILVGLEALGITSFGLADVAEAGGVSGWASVISGVLSLIAAGGLFTLAGWAWILAVVVLVIRIVADILAAIVVGLTSSLGLGSIGAAVISAIILWYFFRPNIRAAFGRS